MSVQVARAVETSGVAVATGGGMLMWLGQNHDAIAAMGVIIGTIVGIAGFFVHWYYLRRDSKRRNRRATDYAS